MPSNPKIAVLLPCYNEEITIANVVADFKKALPQSEIYVFDNCSTDKTAEKAKAAGAHVVSSPRQGKGNVVRHMFKVIDADIYLMADGDGTYPAEHAQKLVSELVDHHADMVVGMRLKEFGGNSFRKFHHFGNRIITGLIRLLFNVRVKDVLSGYRAFSSEFVKSVPLTSKGFAIETELTLQSVAKGFAIREIPIPYGERPEGSHSKLSTFSDGWIILRAIALILKDYKPFLFFGSLAFVLMILSLLSGWAPIQDFYETHYVTHIPRAVLAAALAIMAFVSLAVAVILQTVNRYHNENFILWRKVLSKR